MGLKKSKGNMYEFVTHTWDPIKGECPHNCYYCYVKRNEVPPLHLVEEEFKTHLGKGNFIFVGSRCDIFANRIPREWIERTLLHCGKHDNKYLFQTKDPFMLLEWLEDGFINLDKTIVCTTIETNRFYDQMGETPHPLDRARQMGNLADKGIETYVTIEPIMEFDLDELVSYIKMCRPTQVNIGADSGNCSLPEPKGSEIEKLIEELERFTVIYNKSNLDRLMKVKRSF